jgi:hydrogenase maturation protease
MTEGVLVMGYGNALRTDDGLGWHAAERLADDRRLIGATVTSRLQLTPELALDVSRATLVVLVDARHDVPAGVLSVRRVTRSSDARLTWSHHVDPAGLLALAEDLYGRAPAMFTVGLGVASIEAGDDLSPAIRAALPTVIDAVVDLVVAHAAGAALAEASRA